MLVSFEKFPRGSCGDAALLLGTYLIEQGFGVFAYITGGRGRRSPEPDTWQSHAWLRQGDVIVDVTADQFPEVTEAVIVTTTSPWHATFTQQSLGAADFRRYDESTRCVLGNAYRRILDAAEALDPQGGPTELPDKPG
jgi:hypothetical protein